MKKDGQNLMRIRRAWGWCRGKLWDLKEEDSLKFDDDLICIEIEKVYWDNKNKSKRKQN